MSFSDLVDKRLKEKAVSKAQRRLMGWAHACDKGEADNCPERVKDVGKGFKDDSELRKYAKTKEKGLPKKKHPEKDIRDESDGITSTMSPLARKASRWTDDELKQRIRMEQDPHVKDELKTILHQRWLDAEHNKGGIGSEIPGAEEYGMPASEGVTLADLDFEGIFEQELSTSSGDASPDKKWEPRFEEQPDDAGEAEWIEPKPDYDSADHKFSPKGVIELGVDDEMANKAYDKGGKVTKPKFDTSPYNETIRVEHPLKGRGTVVSISEGIATIEWDRMDLRIHGPEKLTKEQARVVAVITEKYEDDPAEEMLPRKKKKKDKNKDEVNEDQFEHPDTITVAPRPSMTIFQDQEPDEDWKAEPLSTQDGAEAAGDGDEVEGELEEPDDAPEPLNIKDLGDPDSGRGDSIAKQVFSGYDGEGGDQTEIDYDSDRVDYDKQQDSSHNKKDQDSDSDDDSGEDREDDDQDDGQDKDEGREEETMSKRKDENMELTGADLGFDLYESDISLHDMDVEGILTEDARPHMQGMDGGSAGVRDDAHGHDAKDNPSSPLHMKEHELGQGEVAMTKELLAKLLQAVQGVDEEKMESICMGLVNAGNQSDRTLDVQDIGMIMDEIKAAHEGHDEGSEDDAELDQALGHEDEMEEEEACEGCGEGSYEDTAAGDMEEPEGGAAMHRREGKKQIMGSEGAEEDMVEGEGSGKPISDQKTKGKGPGGGSADEMGQKPSDEIIPDAKKGGERGSLGPVTDSNPMPPEGSGKNVNEAWMAAIPGTVRNLEDGDHEIDPEDPDADIKMIKRRAGMDNWWKVD